MHAGDCWHRVDRSAGARAVGTEARLLAPTEPCTPAPTERANTAPCANANCLMGSMLRLGPLVPTGCESVEPSRAKTRCRDFRRRVRLPGPTALVPLPVRRSLAGP